MRRVHPALFLVLTMGLGCTGEAFETTGGGGASGTGASGTGASGTGASASGGSGNQGSGASGNSGNKGTGGDGAKSGTGGSGGSYLGPGEDCTWKHDANPCVDGYYCDAAQNCKDGTCVAIPDEVAPGPVTAACGCDGMAYWNVETAAFYGMPAKKLIGDVVGCGDDAIACQDDDQCGDGHCSLACGQANGLCWMLPPNCPATPTVGVCGTGCTSLESQCEAILNGEPYDDDCP